MKESSDESSLSGCDEALKFLARKDSTEEKTVFADESDDNPATRALIRKIDWMVMPILCGIYLLQFLDKSLLNYAGVMGIRDNLVGNEFANLGTIFSAAFIVASPLAVYMLQVLPPAKVIGGYVVCWGIVVACHAACDTYASLMIVRVLLGIFESVVVPGLVSVSGMFYNEGEQLRRTGLWSLNAGTAMIIGGLLSFAFQHVTTTDFQSWQIFFLVMGLVTVVFGIVTFFFLPSSPIKAAFLSDEDKYRVIEHVRKNQTGVETKKFKKEQLWELLFKDKHTWPMFFLTVASMCSTGGLNTFSATIIRSFGFTSKEAALFQMPSGAITILTILFETYLCSYVGHRTLVFIGMCLPGVAGYSMLYGLGEGERGAKLVAIYLCLISTCVISLIYAWNGKNTAGHTKRNARNGLTMVAFSLGSIIGPQTFQARDAPDYKPAKVGLLITVIVSIPLAALVGVISYYENKRKDANPIEESALPKDFEFLDMTDIENPMFRYSF